MPVHSAGLLLYRVTVPSPRCSSRTWAARSGPRRTTAAWSIPKGEHDPETEPALDAALREFREELGVEPPEGPYAELGTWAYSSGKRITVFVADGAGFSLDGLVFGEFELEWPPRSGRMQSFPEVDRAEWMPVAEARDEAREGSAPRARCARGDLAEACRLRLAGACDAPTVG